MENKNLTDNRTTEQRIEALYNKIYPRLQDGRSGFRQDVNYSTSDGETVKRLREEYQNDSNKERSTVEEYLFTLLAQRGDLLPPVGLDNGAWLSSEFDDYKNGVDVFVQWGGINFAVDFTHSSDSEKIREKMGISAKRTHEFGEATANYFNPGGVARRDEQAMLHLTIGVDDINSMLDYYDLSEKLADATIFSEAKDQMRQERAQITKGLQYKVLREMNAQLMVHKIMAKRDKKTHDYYAACVKAGIKPIGGETTQYYAMRQNFPGVKQTQTNANRVLEYVEDAFENIEDEFRDKSFGEDDAIFQNILNEANAYKDRVKKLIELYEVATESKLAQSVA